MKGITHILFDFNGVLEGVSFSASLGTELNGELLDWMRRHEGIYQYSIISNYGSSLRDALLKLGIAALFDGVYTSSDVGFLKPHPEMFAYVLDDLGVEASSCLFIDDALENTAAASRFGMQVFHFTGNAELFEFLERS